MMGSLLVRQVSGQSPLDPPLLWEPAQEPARQAWHLAVRQAAVTLEAAPATLEAEP